MALQAPLISAAGTGGDYPEAYAKIDVFRGYVDRTFVLVCWYANEESRRANLLSVQQVDFEVPKADVPLIDHTALYAWLKQQPQFVGAVDV
jgi:hypothetical protein